MCEYCKPLPCTWEVCVFFLKGNGVWAL
uniref:Uncharacterized protein n=1 Tax=Anguilla anguilla TaxID=7936 RepID=A0A0E9TN79_ANGAN